MDSWITGRIKEHVFCWDFFFSDLTGKVAENSVHFVNIV